MFFVTLIKILNIFVMEPLTFYMNHNTLLLMDQIILENMDSILTNSK